MSTLYDPQQISHSLTALLGRDSLAKDSKPTLKQAVSVAWYSDDNQDAKAGCICDVALSNFIGAALSMIPAGFARDCAKEGQLPDNTMDNLQEVYNIGAQWFDANNEDPVRLQKASFFDDGPPQDLLNVLSNAAHQRSFQIEISGYGKGTMTLFLLN